MRYTGGPVLLIRRRAGEAILIGDEVEIQIIEISNNRVKLGINAARHIPVVRKEAQLTREQNRRAAAGPDAESVADFLRRFRA